MAQTDNFCRITDIIRRNFPENAVEISDALDLLNLALDGLLDKANEAITEFHKNKDFDKGAELWEFSKSIAEIQKKIDEYSVLMSMDAEIEGEETGEELDETEERRIIPNYSDYVVDNTIPHTLYEDFTHKRVDAFQFNNVRYPAREWKDVLVQTCDLLAEIDADKFSKLIDDPIMKGRKISYFSREYIDGRNTRMKDIDVYVWTNLSANSIVKLIRKLLKRFNIKTTDYYIYLRADYSPLHKK